MMPDTDKILEEAEELFEQNNYAAARALYREAAMLEPPSRTLLANIHVAEELDDIIFSRTLRQRYPTLVRVWINEIVHLGGYRRRWSAQAVSCCTELLQSGIVEGEEMLHIHRLRFRSALHGNASTIQQCSETIVQDFTTIWIAGASNADAVRGKRSLLDAIAALDDPRAITLVEKLAHIDHLPEGVRQFLVMKIEELRRLEALEVPYGR